MDQSRRRNYIGTGVPRILTTSVSCVGGSRAFEPDRSLNTPTVGARVRFSSTVPERIGPSGPDKQTSILERRNFDAIQKVCDPPTHYIAARHASRPTGLECLVHCSCFSRGVH